MAALPSFTRFAQRDLHTGTFRPTHSPRFHVPTNLTIEQFLFSYPPAKAIQPGNDGEGHHRPDSSNKTWLIDSVTGREYTFEQSRQRVDVLSQALHRLLGLRPGQVVVVCAPNDIDYPIVIWATFRAGGIISAANPAYGLEELTYQLKSIAKHFSIAGLVSAPQNLSTVIQAGSSVGLSHDKILILSSLLGPETPRGLPRQILTIAGLIHQLEEHRGKSNFLPVEFSRKIGPGENKKRIAFLSFSSGTTGTPKAVCIPHYSVISNMITILCHDGEDFSGHRCLAVLPYYHIYGLVVVLHANLYRNLANVVMPQFEFQEFVQCIIRYQPSILFLVPPMVILLSRHPGAEKSKHLINEYVKRITCGAAPMSHELISAFRARYPNIKIHQGYGMTETSTQVLSTPNTTQGTPAGSAGVLNPNVSMKILKDGKPVDFGERGEICIKSTSNAICYLDNPGATSETFGADGYIRTGDQGYIDKDGWVYIVDRLKELIKVKGLQVAPAELEGHLLTHPAAQDVGVIGIPDDYAGELPRAYIVINRTHSQVDPAQMSKEMYEFVCAHKTRYKWLEGGIEFVDSIPRNPSGKILRRKLKDSFTAKQALLLKDQEENTVKLGAKL